MDFSSDVLIDVGLNLAGYLVAALLILVIARKKQSKDTDVKESPAATKPQAAASTPVAHQVRKATTVIDPEFVSLSETKAAPAGSDRLAAGPAATPGTPVSAEWRRQNRREIYAEARRLLARGDSPSDLMTKLPVTESELDMLTVAGRA